MAQSRSSCSAFATVLLRSGLSILLMNAWISQTTDIIFLKFSCELQSSCILGAGLLAASKSIIKGAGTGVEQTNSASSDVWGGVPQGPAVCEAAMCRPSDGRCTQTNILYSWHTWSWRVSKTHASATSNCKHAGQWSWQAGLDGGMSQLEHACCTPEPPGSLFYNPG